MSYPQDLDEMDEKRLLGELARRRHNRSCGCCDYCGRPFATAPCKFPERHQRCGAVSKSGEVCTQRHVLIPSVEEFHQSERGAMWKREVKP